jgi:hypothetical protein
VGKHELPLLIGNSGLMITGYDSDKQTFVVRPLCMDLSWSVQKTPLPEAPPLLKKMSKRVRA